MVKRDLIGAAAPGEIHYFRSSDQSDWTIEPGLEECSGADAGIDTLDRFKCRKFKALDDDAIGERALTDQLHNFNSELFTFLLIALHFKIKQRLSTSEDFEYPLNGWHGFARVLRGSGARVRVIEPRPDIDHFQL